MASKLRVGIIGIGGISKAHLPGWNEGEHTEVVAGADVREDVLNAWGREEGVSRLYTDAKELIADPEIDIVDISVPNKLHASLTIAALQAGKHVLCEKPLAPTPNEVRQIIAARDKAGKLVCTMQNQRYTGSALAIKAEADAGAFGEVYHTRAWWLRRHTLPARPGFVFMANSGGGPCIDIGVHVLDLALWFMGHPEPETVTGVTQLKVANQKGAWSSWGGLVPDGIDVEDFAAAFVRFKNGSSLILETSWMMHHRPLSGTGSDDTQIWLYGTKAGAQYPDTTLMTFNADTRQYYDVKPLLEHTIHKSGHASQCIDFANAIAEGRPSPVPPEDSLHLIAILDGLYRSHKAGHEIKLEASL